MITCCDVPILLYSLSFGCDVALMLSMVSAVNTTYTFLSRFGMSLKLGRVVMVRDVKRGQMLKAEAKHSRSRPRPNTRGRGRGQTLEVEAEDRTSRLRPSLTGRV